jgi:hypothetical protein
MIADRPSEKTEDELVNEKLNTPEDLNPEETTYKKRYGDLRSYTAKQLKDLSTVHDTELQILKAQLQQTTQPASTVTDDELEVFKKENPEGYDVLLKVAENAVSSSNDKIKNLEDKLNKTTYEKNRADAKRIVSRKYPDWEEITVSSKFQEWADFQESEIQDWIFSNETNGKLLTKALDLFTIDTGVKSSTRDDNNRLKENASKLLPSNSGGNRPSKQKRTFTRSEIQNMPLGIYEKLESEIKEAQADGRVTNG